MPKDTLAILQCTTVRLWRRRKRVAEARSFRESTDSEESGFRHALGRQPLVRCTWAAVLELPCALSLEDKDG